MNEARFWRHVALSDDSEDACWVWTGSQNCYGRGRFSLKGKIVLAHRIAFEIVRGAVPQGYRLVQTCANRTASGTGGWIAPSAWSPPTTLRRSATASSTAGSWQSGIRSVPASSDT